MASGARKFKFISPGVFTREIDQSQLPADPRIIGPTIFGRARKGPGMRPVLVRSYEEFVNVFGSPDPGAEGGDNWRSGDFDGPTYGAYAAKAWLNSGQAPLTMMRLLGTQHTNFEAGGEAGWDTTGAPDRDLSENGGAYGLFLIDSGSLGTGATATILSTNAPTAANQITIIDAATLSVTFTVTAATTSGTDFGRDGSQNGMDNLKTVIEASALQVAVSAVTEPSTGQFQIVVTQDAAGSGGETTITSNLANVSINGGSAAANGTFAGSTANGLTTTGSLAAVWYLEKSASIALSGNFYGAASGIGTASAGTYIQSRGASKEFVATIFSSGETIAEKVCFNFDENSDKYIRKVFSTNASQTNSTIVDSNTNAYKRYWLGESYDQMVRRTVSNSGESGNVLGVILALASGSASALDFDDHNQGFQNAETPYFRSQDLGIRSNFFLENTVRLFKLVSLEHGSWIQRNVKISIEEIRAADYPEINPYGTFSVVLRSVRDTDNAPQVIERYDLCNLNPNSPDYVAKKIGDKFVEWSPTERRLRQYGDYDNQSAYVRVVVDEGVANGGADASALPFGYFGPPRFKGFTVLSGSTLAAPNALGDTVVRTNVLDAAQVPVLGSSSIALPGGTLTTPGSGRFAATYHGLLGALTSFTASYNFPAIRTRLSASDGGINPTDAYFGIQTTKEASSITFDPSYIDMVRPLPAPIATQTFVPGANTENSFSFTLDNIRFMNGAREEAYYLSGSRKSGASWTAASGSRSLLENGYDKFTAPMFGGFDGLNIVEKEPFRNSYLSVSGQTELNNYGINTLRRSIDTVADPEFVETNLMSIPGIWTPAITDKLITTCEERADALAVVDIQYAYTPAGTEDTSSAVQRRPDVTQAATTLRARSINSSYGCTFFPWVQIRDTNTNRLVDVPPSVAAIGTFGSSQARSELWFAPAGFVRGGLSNGAAGVPVTGVKMRLTSKDRDTLYSMNINPIATFPNEGIVIFGQKTLQVTRSALDRINVRRLLIFIKKEISTIANTILFDPNVQTTWDRFTSAVNPFLADVKARFGLTDFRVILDSTTTTDDLIDRNILYAKIYLKPARAIEFIALDFIVTRTGASFDD